jgi:type III secretory pathway lipoprotein EscJ
MKADATIPLRLARAILIPPPLLLAATLLSGCRTEILSDLTEHQAGKIVHELGLRGIEASITHEGKQRHAIVVAKADSTKAAGIASVIRPLLPNQSGLDKPPSILSSPDQERLYIARQLANQLEESIQLLPEVVATRVTIAYPPPPSIKDHRLIPPPPGSASVLVITSSNSLLGSESIASFIANGTSIPKDRIHVIVAQLPQTINMRHGEQKETEQSPPSTPNLVIKKKESVPSAEIASADVPSEEGRIPTSENPPHLPSHATQERWSSSTSLMIGITSCAVLILFLVGHRKLTQYTLRLAFRNLGAQ